MAELVDTNSATAKASDIVESKTAYVKSGLVAGTIPKQAGSTIVPGTASKTAVERGVYMDGDIVMAGDANLKPENIAKGVTMFGVKGTWEGEPPKPGLPDGFYEISVQSEPKFAGEVSGGGVASQGMLVTISAEKKNRFYEFSEWKENDNVVSNLQSYQFKVKEPRQLKAVFERPAVDWFEANKLPQNYMRSVVYGDSQNIFVAVGGTSSSYPQNAMYSYDGITWTISSVSALTALGWDDVAYGNGYFVAVGYNSNTNTNNFTYSSNGTTWSSGAFPVSGKWNCVAYGNDRFVALQDNSTSSNLVYTKSNVPTPSQWAYSTLPVTGRTWNGIAYGHGKFVAVGSGNGIYSFDGISWIESPSIPWAKCIAFGGDKFVALPSSGQTVYYSEDGLAWEASELPFSASALYPWGGVAYGNGYFVAVGTSKSDRVAMSKDGIVWKESTLPIPVALSDVAYGDGKFVAVTGDFSYQAVYGEHKEIYTISVAAEPEGSEALTGEGIYFEGESVTVTASPTELWYEFKEWRENGNVVSNNPIYTFIAGKDRDLVAVSNTLRYTISGEANPKDGGYITGTGEYLKSETVELCAVPNDNDGYLFTEWKEGDVSISQNPIYSFEVTKHRNLIANFKKLTISDLNVGDIVKINVDNIPTEFIIVQQGLPSNLYDKSCDGTWLLMKNIYITMKPETIIYKDSAIHKYLTSDFLNLLDSDLQNQILDSKIPYRSGTGSSAEVSSGSSGLNAKIFLLSAVELGSAISSGLPAEGGTLRYFVGSSIAGKRIAYLDEIATRWWTRTPYVSSSYTSWSHYVDQSGGMSMGSVTLFDYGVRPALILQSNTLVLADGTVITA